MKTIIYILTILFTYQLNGQTTAIPDPVFEQVLINKGLDTGPIDGVVTTANINMISELIVNNSSITDLTGVEDFTALVKLDCHNNQLTSLDVSQNLALVWLNCQFNQITTLDVTQNTDLDYFTCMSNQLNVIDVTQNTLLTSFFCGSNQLTNLDISQNQILASLNCDYNQLTSLGTSQNTMLTSIHCNKNQISNINIVQNQALQYLFCNDNHLTSIDVSLNSNLTELSTSINQLTNLDVTHNAILRYLVCHDNELTSLDVSQNAGLEQLNFSNNQISEIDVSQNLTLVMFMGIGNPLGMLDFSQNTSLTSLACDYCQLTCVNLKNGTVTNSLSLNNNPDLHCLSVDDVSISQTNWHISAQMTLSLNCMDSCTTSVPASIDQGEIVNNPIFVYPNPTNGPLTIDLSEFSTNINATLFNCLGQTIFFQTFEYSEQISFEIEAPKGLYFLQLDTDFGKSEMIKVIKE